MKLNKKKFDKELVVKSSTDNLSLIRDFTKSAAEESGFSNEAIGKIILAVDEACTNIIKHAYKFSPEGSISISIKFNGSKFSISIIDSGINFNPKVVPDPDLKKYHIQRKVGGLGMFLMKKLMDEVEYNHLSGNRNQVVLIKYLV